MKPLMFLIIITVCFGCGGGSSSDPPVEVKAEYILDAYLDLQPLLFRDLMTHFGFSFDPVQKDTVAVLEISFSSDEMVYYFREEYEQGDYDLAFDFNEQLFWVEAKAFLTVYVGDEEVRKIVKVAQSIY